MLSDNIKKFRKAINMSQDELAEKLDVSRQSISLWESGQTQPTIDNLIALTKIFGVSVDDILNDEENFKKGASIKQSGTAVQGSGSYNKANRIKSFITKCKNHLTAFISKDKKRLWILIGIAAAVIITVVTLIVVFAFGFGKADNENPSHESEIHESIETANEIEKDKINKTDKTENNKPTDSAVKVPVVGEPSTEPQFEPAPVEETPAPVEETPAPVEETPAPVEETPAPVEETSTPTTTPPATAPSPVENFDLFNYYKQLAINIGTLNGDYSMYQQPATRYGGYEGEYFSVSYWSGSDMVEFCLHCPLNETVSINFYLRMRGGYNGKYEYLASRYYRSDGVGFRELSGYIDPAVFSETYPLGWNNYDGSADKQTDFIEECRVGYCDLIKLMKQFTITEDLDCSFDKFGFVNF